MDPSPDKAMNETMSMHYLAISVVALCNHKQVILLSNEMVLALCINKSFQAAAPNKDQQEITTFLGERFECNNTFPVLDFLSALERLDPTHYTIS